MNERVGRDEEEAVLEGLTDEHPIERVFVMEIGPYLTARQQGLETKKAPPERGLFESFRSVA